jgi:type IV pilus assembly protein PilY1
MYAADNGGRIFRFDIFSGANASSLVYGSVFAKLGNGAAAGGNDAPSPNSSTRRFYNAPDVALIQRRGADSYYNLAIGSGYRGHPLYKVNLDRFYSLRDKQPYAKFNSNNALTPITEASAGFVNITPDPINANVGTSAPGWMLVFDPTNAQTGEKVLNEATTVNGVVLFSTYTPQAASSAEPCRPSSINKVYALRADNGHPALDLNGDGVINNSDMFENVIHEGILGGVNVGVLRGTLADALGGTPTVCLAGMHILGKCVNVSDSVRTYWRKPVD